MLIGFMLVVCSVGHVVYLSEMAVGAVWLYRTVACGGCLVIWEGGWWCSLGISE